MSEFTDAVAAHCSEFEAVNVGCLGEHCEYADGDENHQCEPSFSRQPCDSCGSTLGGDREEAYGMYRGDKTSKMEFCKMDICVDCVMFHVNGDEPEDWGG